MGCQTEIAEKIVEAGADYCLAVKENRPTLCEGIAEFFNDHLDDNFARTQSRRHETHERGHGRAIREAAAQAKARWSCS
jgi:predicted transposase YbfD/YdcC